MTQSDANPEIAHLSLLERTQAEITQTAHHIRDMVLTEVRTLPVEFPEIEVMRTDLTKGQLGRIALGDPHPTKTVPGIVVDRLGYLNARADTAVVLLPGGLYRATAQANRNQAPGTVFNVFPSSQEQTNVLWLTYGPKVIKKLEELKTEAELPS